MTQEQMTQEFKEFIEDNKGAIMIIFDMAQNLVQEVEDSKQGQALNIVVGSSFALLHALHNYMEVSDGENVGYSS